MSAEPDEVAEDATGGDLGPGPRPSDHQGLRMVPVRHAQNDVIRSLELRKGVGCGAVSYTHLTLPTKRIV